MTCNFSAFSEPTVDQPRGDLRSHTLW